jgi:hypothetical protein
MRLEQRPEGLHDLLFPKRKSFSHQIFFTFQKKSWFLHFVVYSVVYIAYKTSFMYLATSLSTLVEFY